MPFGFHLAMDTLPSGVLREDGFRFTLACFRLSLSCPFRFLHTYPFSPASEALPPLLDTVLLIRAPEGLQPS
jgi:hypothetical protein